MKRVKGNILNAPYGVIGHAVSCTISEWTVGLSKEIGEKFPRAYEEYTKIDLEDKNRLGKCQIVEVNPRILFVANMFVIWGKSTPENTAKTEINSIAAALVGLRNWHRSKDLPDDYPIYLPHRIFCGDDDKLWKPISDLVSYHLPNVIIVRDA